MTNPQTENVYFVYENNTPGDIKRLLEDEYPSAKTFNINEIERLKESVVLSKEAQAVAVIFDGSAGKRKGASYKEELRVFKEAMGVYFKTNVVFVEVFTNFEASKSHLSKEEVTHNCPLTNNSPMQRSQANEDSSWFSDLVAETCEKRFVRIDRESTTDFAISVSKITLRIESFEGKLNLICKICMVLCGLVLCVGTGALWVVITCYNTYKKLTCNSS